MELAKTNHALLQENIPEKPIANYFTCQGLTANIFTTQS